MEAVAQETGLDFYRTAFEELEERRQSETFWLQKLRQEAFARFLTVGFPTAKLEAWKYTNVGPIASTPWARATAVAVRPVIAEAALRLWRIPGAVEIVFVNGHFSREHSRLDGLENGVRVASLTEVLTQDPNKAEPWVGRLSPADAGAFAALNTAFFQDGAYIEIGAGTVAATPIHLFFVTAEEEAFAFSSPRILIVAGPRSQATLVETYIGESGAVALTNSVTEIIVRDGAVVEHYKVQQESLAGYHVHALTTRQDRASSFTSHNIALGAALARTDINVLFEAQGSECTLNGLFLGAGTQHIDNHTLIDHAKPHCFSRELYKGIMDGRSRGVFHGTIVVRPDAQKTDAMQTNKNLLLSKEALVNSTPALEIFADDVKCKHGSTIGQLDPAALFYVRSRGIGEEEARSLLTYAFAADIAARIKVAPIRARIEASLGMRLGRRAETP